MNEGHDDDVVRGFAKDGMAAEAARNEAEDFRRLAEEAREVRDHRREALETIRQERERLRETAETARMASEEARFAAETARTASEEARVATETARQAVVNDRGMHDPLHRPGGCGRFHLRLGIAAAANEVRESAHQFAHF